MHAEDTALARSTAVPALTAVVAVARPGQPDAAKANSFELAVAGTADDERSLSVRYELDAVTHRWVASIMDDRSGEVVRTVPSKQILHQLAALRRPPLDVRA
jgi:hypothetical protein